MLVNRIVSLQALVLTASVFGAAGANAASDPTGIWINDTGRGAIEIKSCGDAMCGHVVWVKDGADTKGCGKQIIGDVRSVGGGRWDNGWIYSPEKKKNYDVELKPLDNGKLRVTGYAGVKFLSKTMIWTKAPDDLQRCDATEAKATPAQAPAAATAQAKAPAPAVKQAAVEPARPKSNSLTGTLYSMTKPAPAEAPAASATEAQKVPTTEEKAPEATTGNSATEAAPETQTAEEESGGSEGLDLGGLNVDKFLKRTADGKCKLDTPWIKIKFDCEK